MKKEEKPYIRKFKRVVERKYNPNYGDNRICKCGHPYYRHFDSYDNMFACGCKYCPCYIFQEQTDGDIDESNMAYNKVQIQVIQQESVFLYHKRKGFVGKIENELEFNNVRAQIKELGVEGFYIKRNNGEEIEIDSNGRYDDRGCESELYPEFINIASKLL